MALFYSTQMAQLLANAGGVIQQLFPVTIAGARQRVFVANVTLAAQPSGSQIAVARIPLGAILEGATVITDTSLGAATISFGDANSPAIYGAAATVTAVQTPQRFVVAATYGAVIQTGYDALTGAVVNFQTPGEGGAFYEDVILTVGAAALPASGNMVVVFTYAID